jgi:TonB family protein
MRLLLRVSLLLVSVSPLVSSQEHIAGLSLNGLNLSSSRASQAVRATPQPTFALEPMETANVPYPVGALTQKIEGQVLALILVSETGAVETFQILKGDPLLGASVREALKKWTFKPVLKDGVPVAVSSKLVFNFKLSDETQRTSGVVPEISSASELPQRVHLARGVSEGLILKRIEPNYPASAIAARLEGQVILRAVINREGGITDLTLVSGHPNLVPAAIKAVRQWKFRQSLFLGRPVEVETEIVVDFILGLR